MPGSTPPPSARIVFSHANGFPAGTYRLLFEAWRAAGCAVHALPRFGHDSRFPVTSNWPHLRDELIHFIEAEAGGPAHLVGHSLGGYVSVLVAARRPDLATGLVLLDSPILSGWKARALQVAKAAGIGERLSPAHVSKRRRQHWESVDAAYTHFAAKPLFARWAPGVLRDYVESGTEPESAAERSSRRRLAFDREVETAIYNSLPHHMARLLRTHPLQCPMAFIRGSESVEVRRVGLATTARMAQGRISVVEGSHLFPFEKPQETAAEVLRWIAAFATPRANTASEASAAAGR